MRTALKTDVKTTVRLSDFAEQGEYTPLAKLEGVDLELVGLDFPIETKYGEAWKMNLVEVDPFNETPTAHVVLTSAVVISRALAKFQEAIDKGKASFPIPVRFVKPENTWLIE